MSPPRRNRPRPGGGSSPAPAPSAGAGATDPDDPPRGAHTLDVVEGTVEGIYGDDVFVELGPRKEGVLSARAFLEPPRVGETYRFTLRGREDSLWILNLVEERTLEQWETLEEDSLTGARVLQKTHDGYQLKIGPLHAYMPFSESGIRRSRDRDKLLGRSVVVMVLSVDADKQRAVVSRKAVLRMQREGGDPHAIVPGQTIQGRVTRIEPYGAFIRFGSGKEGLCHISNLSANRIEHPSEVVAKGDVVEARVLHVRAGGRRVALGIKQLDEPPWQRAEREHWEGQIVTVEIVRTASFGAIARLLPGVEGIVPVSEWVDPRRGPAGLAQGEVRSARIMEFDPDAQRIAFSLRHPGGAPIDPEEAETMAAFESVRRMPSVARVMAEDPEEAPAAATNLGALLQRALGPKDADRGAKGPA